MVFERTNGKSQVNNKNANNRKYVGLEMSIETEKLTIYGGKPVRTKKYPPCYLGTSVMGNEELELLTEVVRNKLQFRDYGDGIPHMVKDFELEAREYFGVPYSC